MPLRHAWRKLSGTSDHPYRRTAVFGGAVVLAASIAAQTTGTALFTVASSTSPAFSTAYLPFALAAVVALMFGLFAFFTFMCAVGMLSGPVLYGFYIAALWMIGNGLEAILFT